MSNKDVTLVNFLMDLALVAIPTIAGSVLMYYTMKKMSGPKDGVNDAQMYEAYRKASIQWRRTHPSEPFPTITEYEQVVLADLVFPDEVQTCLADVGGLSSIKDSLMETVVLPLRNPTLYSLLGDSQEHLHDSEALDGNRSLYSSVRGSGHDLLHAPMGVLFYGPPGTGKTLTARALARESGATFLPVSISTLESKWVGESQKIVRALFSLARKLAPTIIFIDEIDVMLTNRGSGTHEHSARIIAEFLSQWDGLTSSPHGVVVIGATNRVSAVDEAILRRMPRKLLFDLPEAEERHMILRTLLSKVAVDEALTVKGCSGQGREAALAFLTQNTDRYSGADLKELCRFAAMIPMREYVRECRMKQLRAPQTISEADSAAAAASGLAPRAANVLLDSDYGAAPTRPRLMQLRDLEEALVTLRPSAETSAAHAEEDAQDDDRMSLLRALAQAQMGSGGKGKGKGGKKGSDERVNRAELELAQQVLMRAHRYGLKEDQ